MYAMYIKQDSKSMFRKVILQSLSSIYFLREFNFFPHAFAAARLFLSKYLVLVFLIIRNCISPLSFPPKYKLIQYL